MFRCQLNSHKSLSFSALGHAALLVGIEVSTALQGEGGVRHAAVLDAAREEAPSGASGRPVHIPRFGTRLIPQWQPQESLCLTPVRWEDRAVTGQGCDKAVYTQASSGKPLSRFSRKVPDSAMGTLWLVQPADLLTASSTECFFQSFSRPVCKPNTHTHTQTKAHLQSYIHI